MTGGKLIGLLVGLAACSAPAESPAVIRFCDRQANGYQPPIEPVFSIANLALVFDDVIVGAEADCSTRERFCMRGGIDFSFPRNGAGISREFVNHTSFETLVWSLDYDNRRLRLDLLDRAGRRTASFLSCGGEQQIFGN